MFAYMDEKLQGSVMLGCNIIFALILAWARGILKRSHGLVSTPD